MSIVSCLRNSASDKQPYSWTNNRALYNLSFYRLVYFTEVDGNSTLYIFSKSRIECDILCLLEQKYLCQF